MSTPTKPNPMRLLPLGLAVLLICALPVVASTPSETGERSFQGIRLVDEMQAPGLEMEISGIHPHPTRSDLYYVAANQRPVYRGGETPLLPEEYRGKLLTVNRQGEVVEAFDLVGGDYGGMAYGDGHLFVSSLDPAEILKVDPADGRVVARFPIDGPAGGLEYDPETNRILAQLFLAHPHLAVIDAGTGATVEQLWSDESAMGLAKVDGDLLCTWANSFETDGYGELRLLDGETGHVKSRISLDRVHTSLAPAEDGFLSLVATGEEHGQVVVRRYAYRGNEVTW